MKKILIIEDEKVLSEMYKFKFSKEGYDIINAVDVETGLSLMESDNPDLVILDILLPKESGINFLEKYKGDVPVIVLSNFDDNETKNKAFSLGAKDYIIKSNLDPQEVLEKIKSYLKE
ncbi:MAG: response regulator transcription factor [Candidatus Pacebacteria bacterium]|nr:response regulator transcription factor [Candidatus Paceibacterota bacterium]MDD5013336.1 response regulator transcription factor [Candidatus Paceibacterota bacterium]MDD5752624.1 response regulator transcription factor [Candidatus Paceibacterota bacterium]